MTCGLGKDLDPEEYKDHGNGVCRYCGVNLHKFELSDLDRLYGVLY